MHQELFKPNLGFLLTFHSFLYLIYYLFFGLYAFFQMPTHTIPPHPNEDMTVINFLNLCNPKYVFILLFYFTGSLYARYMF